MSEEITNVQKLVELRKQHGAECEGYETPDGDLIVVGRPNNADAEYQRFFNESTKVGAEADRASANKDLVLSCVKHPDSARAKHLVERWPAMVLPMVRDCERILGGQAKKLGK